MTNNLIIIGSGPSAYTAAIYAARAKLDPVVIAGEQSGGQLMWTTEVENYPGFPTGILGPDLMAAMRKQVERLGVKIIDKNATALKKENGGFSISLISSDPSSFFLLPSSFITASAVIIATGASSITLKLPGEDRLMGRGVGTCAVCDAPFYKDKDTVFVVGGGDSAVEESMALSKYAENVILLVRRDQMRASAVMQDRIKMSKNIKIWYKSQAREFIGDKRLEKVRITKDGQDQVYPADGFFYAIGHTPATGWLKGSGVTLDKKGYIVTPISTVFSEHSENSESQNVRPSDTSGAPSIPSFLKSQYPTMTSVPGIFAAGDCVDMRYRQAITAAGYGCMAALDAQKWMENN